MWKPLPSRHILKTLRGESPKRTISASDGLGPLQMVSEPNIGRCVSEEAEPRRRMDTRQCASEEAKPRREVDTRQCASKDAGPGEGGLGGPTSIGERNEC